MKRIKKVKYEIKSNRRLSINIKEKSSGFTLIELIAVIAIIMILSGVLFPKVLGYVQEAKKLKVVDQCRKIVMATESYNLRYIPLEKNQSVSSIINKDGIKKYINEEEFKNGLDIVVIARPSAKDRSFQEIESALLHVWKRHHITGEDND